MEQFEVIFLDGDTVKYKGKTPEKPATNQIKYSFIGWIGEEKMNSVQERLILVAKYSVETISATKDENAMLQASLENAENTNLLEQLNRLLMKF